MTLSSFDVICSAVHVPIDTGSEKMQSRLYLFDRSRSDVSNQSRDRRGTSTISITRAFTFLANFDVLERQYLMRIELVTFPGRLPVCRNRYFDLET
jgi:hypothetical protein